MSKLVYSLIYSLLFFILSYNNVHALVINEISSFTSEDWIELYSNEDLDLTGYELVDSAGNSKVIEGEILIGPSTKEYLVVDFSNRLNKDEDSIVLYNKEKDTVDNLSYGKAGEICAPEEGNSLGRKPNGTGNFQRLAESSRGVVNLEVEAACPTPKPDPTTTPTSAPTEAPVKTQTPKPTILPTSTPKVLGSAKSPTPTSSPKNINENNHSWTTPENSPVSSPETEVLSDTTKKITPKKVAGLFILAGILFVSYPLFRFYKSKKEEKLE